jgi:hypothetical protein
VKVSPVKLAGKENLILIIKRIFQIRMQILKIKNTLRMNYIRDKKYLKIIKGFLRCIVKLNTTGNLRITYY